MFFGHPITQAREKDINEWAAIKFLTIDEALIYSFKKLAFYNSQKNEKGLCFYDYLLSEKAPEKIYAPKIFSQTYVNESAVLPTLVISTDLMRARSGNGFIHLNDGNIEHIGSRFEDIYGYKYFGYKTSQVNH